MLYVMSNNYKLMDNCEINCVSLKCVIITIYSLCVHHTNNIKYNKCQMWKYYVKNMEVLIIFIF